MKYINAPEGCQHGTHTNGTAYTRGTYSKIIQTHKNKSNHTASPDMKYIWAHAVQVRK